MKGISKLFLVAIILATSLLTIAATRDAADPKPFLIVGHRYKCVVHGDDFEVTVREVIDHQWIRGEVDGMTMHLPEGDRTLTVLINLANVNMIMPRDEAEVRANLVVPAN